MPVQDLKCVHEFRTPLYSAGRGMRERAKPPDDISPTDFFTRWLAESVARDGERRARLGDTRARLCFELLGEGGGVFTVDLENGVVEGVCGRLGEVDLSVRLDVDTWRALNRGELTAPRAVLKRRLRLRGDLRFALKLYMILG